MFKYIFHNNKITYLVPSADASCEYSKGNIISVSRKWDIQVQDLQDNHINFIFLEDIITFDKFNCVKKYILKLIFFMKKRY
tara:strand:- start:1273 stop:1515 length:243 start_codon:yes stop_codon:yes gene_type:complete